MSHPYRCHWCVCGKPPEVREPFRNPNCDMCQKKPTHVNGVRVRSTAEIRAERKRQRMERGAKNLPHFLANCEAKRKHNQEVPW